MPSLNSQDTKEAKSRKQQRRSTADSLAATRRQPILSTGSAAPWPHACPCASAVSLLTAALTIARRPIPLERKNHLRRESLRPPQILRSLTNPHANRQNPPIPPTRPLIRTAPHEMNVRSSDQAQRLHQRCASQSSGDGQSPFSPAQAGNHETSDYGRSRIHWQSYR